MTPLPDHSPLHPARPLRWIILIATASAVLAGCGGKDEPPAGSAPASTRQNTDRQNTDATAEDVAREARGSLRCPARTSLPARAANAPVDDVVGVRPGMSYQDAVNTVLCSHELLVVTPEQNRGFNIETYDVTLRQGFNGRFAKPRVQRTSQQIMQEMQDSAMARGSNRLVRDVLPGESKWYVTTMGLPEEEKVIAAAREEWFQEDAQPTLESVQHALLEKYGMPTEISQGGNELRWAYELNGALITAQSRLFNRCMGTNDPNVGTNHTSDCGVVVKATLLPLPSNPALAQRMQVGVVDHANGYQAIVGTERALEAAEMQRRAAQADEAGRNAKKPTL